MRRSGLEACRGEIRVVEKRRAAIIAGEFTRGVGRALWSFALPYYDHPKFRSDWFEQLANA